MAAATPLTPAEFIAEQTQEAATLRTAILAGPDRLAVPASPGGRPDHLDRPLPGRADAGGLLRPEDVPPAVHQIPSHEPDGHPGRGHPRRPGRATDHHQRQPRRVLRQVQQWYGNDPTQTSPYIEQPVRRQRRSMPRRHRGRHSRRRPASSTSSESSPTHYEAFNVYVNYANDFDLDDDHRLRATRRIPTSSPSRPPTSRRSSAAAGRPGQAPTRSGRIGYGPAAVPPGRASRCPTRPVQQPVHAPSTVGQVRIVSQLDPNLDPRSFRLGDLQIGDLQVHIPNTVGSFQGDFDFTQTKGFILRVSAGIDLQSDTITWLLQAIDPATGEVVQDPTQGCCRPAAAPAGFVTYTVEPLAGLATGTQISAQAQLLFNTVAAAGHQHRHQHGRRHGPDHDLDRHADHRRAAPTTRCSGPPRRPRRLGRQGRDGLRLGGRRRLPDLARPDDRDLGHLQRPGRPHLPVPGAGDRQRRQPRSSPPRASRCPATTRRPTWARCRPCRRPRSTSARRPQSSAAAVDQPAVHPGAAGIPAPTPATGPSEFQSVLQPFTAQAFATGIAPERGRHRPGGHRRLARRLGRWSAAARPQRALPLPGREAARRRLRWPPSPSRSTTWRSTPPAISGRPPAAARSWSSTRTTGAILGQFGDSLTQSLAIQPGTG